MKVVIFDLWKTLVNVPKKNNPVREFLQKFNIPPESSGQARFFAMAFMVERRSIEESVKDFLFEHKIRETPELISEMIEIMNRGEFDNKNSEVFPESLPVLKKLKEMGIKTAILSNAIYVPKYHDKQYIPDEWKIGKYLDDLFISFDTENLKPDTIAYTTVLDKMKIKPEEAMFVDDHPLNVFAAKEIGMNGLLIDRKNKYDYPDRINSLNEVFKFL